MVDLGFTITPCNSHLFNTIMEWAPRDGVPDLTPEETEKAQNAFTRYEALVGLIDPEDYELSQETLAQDRHDYPNAGQDGIDISEQLFLMIKWSGLESKKAAAYLYESIIYNAACGIDRNQDGTDWTAEECRLWIEEWHQEWFVAA